MVTHDTRSKQNAKLSGVGLAPGLAAGRAFIYRDILWRDHDHREPHAPRIDEECARFDEALREVQTDLKVAAERIERDLDSNMADIFRAQATMLGDPCLAREFKHELERESVTAERAVQRVFQSWIRRLRDAKSQAVVRHEADVADLSRRLLRVLVGIDAHTLEDLPEGSVVVAQRLLPSDTIHLTRRSTAGVVVAWGGAGSHAALLTRELGIPAVGQLRDGIDEIEPGDQLLVDGSSGSVIVAPTAAEKSWFEDRMRSASAVVAQTRARCHDAAVTSDGVPVQVCANIGSAEDAVVAAESGADGIGLFRIEWLYLSRKTPPSEDALLEQIGRAIAPFQGRPVTVRLLDVGTDKPLPFLNRPAEADSALGHRGVRLLLDHLELVRGQLRVLSKLARQHDVRVLIPMVTTVEDVERVRVMLHQTAEELDLQYPPSLGAMIETPAAALCTADIARQADFLSIGTNDLTQYVMAAGRENAFVADYFVDDHPAVRRLVRLIGAESGDKPLAVCGELAGRESAVRELIEAGVRTLSVAPGRVPAIKEAVRGL